MALMKRRRRHDVLPRVAAPDFATPYSPRLPSAHDRLFFRIDFHSYAISPFFQSAMHALPPLAIFRRLIFTPAFCFDAMTRRRRRHCGLLLAHGARAAARFAPLILDYGAPPARRA